MKEAGGRTNNEENAGCHRMKEKKCVGNKQRNLSGHVLTFGPKTVDPTFPIMQLDVVVLN